MFDEDEDPEAAPGRNQESDPAPPRTWQRARQNSLWVYLVGLPFLLFAIPSITAGDPGPLVLAARTILTLLIGAYYVGGAWVTDFSLAARWCYVAGFVALLLASALTWSWGFAYFGVYVAVLVSMLIPWRQARPVIIGWGAVLVVIAVVTPESGVLFVALIGLVTGLSMGAGMESGRVSGRLRRAEQRVAALAVVAERERISRDLHDILGHSLTAIAIKTELAERLVEPDPTAARSQLREVTAIARQALADVRSTASAIREVRLAGELAGAASVLQAAGIEARVPTALPVLDDSASELFGYVVRESVTNVVRHSEATRCTITVAADQVEIADDGTGSGTANGGRGLPGLAERLAAAGGVLEVIAEPGVGTRIIARVSGKADG